LKLSGQSHMLSRFKANQLNTAHTGYLLNSTVLWVKKKKSNYAARQCGLREE